MGKDEEHEESGDNGEDGVERISGIDCHRPYLGRTGNLGYSRLFIWTRRVGVPGSKLLTY
jgi:hypothetical protein